MPPGGAAAVDDRWLPSDIAHTKFIDPAIELLEDLRSYGSLRDSDEASLIRITQQDYERAVAHSRFLHG